MRQEMDLGQKRYDGLSLLWEDVKVQSFREMKRTDLDDLNLSSVEAYFEENFKLNIAQTIQKIPNRIEDSLYRQEIMVDFIENNSLFDILLEYGQKAHHMMSLSKFAFEREATVYNLIKRMDEVETIRLMLETVYKWISRSKINSKGLNAYYSLLKEILDSPIYEAFMADVQHIKSLEQGVKSLKIGINLDEYLQPIEAILLEISSEEFEYSRFGKKISYFVNAGIHELLLLPRRIFARETILAPDALNTLEKTIEPATLQLIRFCDQFTMKILEVLSVLFHDLPYYQVGIEIHRYLIKHGFDTVVPKWYENKTTNEITNEQTNEITNEYAFSIEGIYNLNLAFSMDVESIKKNDVFIKSHQRCIILTGANRGGKTTFSQSFVQLIWMAQCGFYVPSTRAILLYLDHILLHFAKEETQSISYGRLGEECMRFKTLYDQGTKWSLYCMNESFSGTSYQESIQIAIESLRAIYAQGGYVLFNTHLHELVGELEKQIPEDAILSLIAAKNMETDPYKVEIGPPLGKSYALKIAQLYGMTYEQLMN